MALLEIDELQANAILDMQLRRLAALERQKIIDRLAELEAEHRRPRGHPRQRGAAAADHLRGARRDRREVRQRAPQPDHPRRRRPVDGGPDPRRGPRRDDHPRRLRQAHPRRPLPHPEARRQGRARRDAARRRRRRALHGDQQPPLAAVLHHRRPGLPHQGLQPPRGVARRQGRSRRRAAVLPARRGHRAGAGDPRLRAGAVPRAGHPQRAGQEDPARRLQQPAAGRRHRDQLPRGRRRADRRRAGRRRRRHPAGLPQGPGDPVPRRRRPAAADGPGHVRCHRHEVPRRRPAAVDVGDPRRAGRGRGGRRRPGRARRRVHRRRATCRTSRSSTSSRSPTAASPSARGSPTTACSPAAASASRR